MDGFLKKRASSITSVPKKAQQLLTEEPFEVLKIAKSQFVGREGAQSKASVVGQVTTSDTGFSELPPQEEKELKEKARKRIRELEEELKKMREERRGKEEEWKTQQGAKFSEKVQEVPQPLIEPTTRPKRGMFGFIKRKQGTKEMGKSVSG